MKQNTRYLSFNTINPIGYLQWKHHKQKIICLYQSHIIHFLNGIH